LIGALADHGRVSARPACKPVAMFRQDDKQTGPVVRCAMIAGKCLLSRYPSTRHEASDIELIAPGATS